MTRRYCGYLLLVLCVANALNFGDRILFGICQELIRGEFHLNDFQIGLLGGPAFALLYTVMGFPIARLAERRDRVHLLSMAIAFWSLMTLCGGLVANYWQLFASRMGISLGEAGCAPPAHSLISDHFEPERRATAFSLYAIGAPLGSLLMATAGGAIAQAFGWRAAFVAAGTTGMVLAILAVFTLREPRRAAGAPGDRAGFVETLRYLAAKPAVIHTCMGGAAAGFGGIFILQYMTSFLVRSHHMQIASAALAVGLIAGLASAMGQWISGIVADRWGRRNARAILLVPTIGLSLSAVCYLAAFSWMWLPFTLGALSLAGALLNSYMGQSFAVMQSLAPSHMRATAAATFLFFSSLFGTGLGPPILGATSDAAAKAFLPAGVDPSSCAQLTDNLSCAVAAAEGLRVALIVGSLALVWAAAHYWLAARRFHVETAAPRHGIVAEPR